MIGSPRGGFRHSLATEFSNRQPKNISHIELHHTYATNLLNAGTELVDIQALLGHESISTAQIDTPIGQERMEKVLARIIHKKGRRSFIQLI